MSWDEWFRRRMRRPFYTNLLGFNIDELMREMEDRVDRMFNEFEDRIPRSLIRERKLPDGALSRQMGPFIYGFSMTLGPNRKPIIKEFGNLGALRRTRPSEPPLDLKDEREPLVDVIEGDKDVRVVAELPGVEKEEIKLNANKSTLTISVDIPDRKYHKELDLPAEVEPKNARSTYRNGVLEVILPKRRKRKGKSLKTV